MAAAACFSTLHLLDYRNRRLEITNSFKEQSKSLRPMAHQDPIRSWILDEGGATEIIKVSPVGGGCISTANQYETDVGSFFVKTNRDSDISMFEAEAAGLNAMYATKTIRVPKPLKVGSLSQGSFIIMEFIELASSRGKSQEELGRQLGLMHETGTSDKGFGFFLDNTIGSTHQPNPWTENWITFFKDHRIGYQLQLIQQQYKDSSLFEKGQELIKKIPDLLKDVEVKPCLLHGDLWSGNLAYDKQSQPVILDPACYYGHSEAEFGMSWCASFDSTFYKGYFEVIPKQAGFEERSELYKLYHYLNHYNLFGTSYRQSCLSIINRFVR